MDCGGNVGIDQSQAVIVVDRCGLIGETEVVKRPKQPVARAITGEDSSRAIATMSRGRQADNQDPRADRTEAWYRPSPILRFTKAANFSSCDFLSIGNEPRAAPAIDNLTLGR